MGRWYDISNLEQALQQAQASGRDKRDTAFYLKHKACHAEAEHENQISLELFLKAAELFREEGMVEKQAECIDWAGKSAHYLRDFLKKAELKQEAGRLYETIDDEKAAGYSYLWAADALLALDHREIHADKIRSLMERGKELLSRSAPHEDNHFLRRVFSRYEGFESMMLRKGSGSRQTGS